MSHREKSGNKTLLIYVISLAVVIAIFVVSVIRTNIYNKTTYHKEYTGASFFSAGEAEEGEISVRAVPRSNSWTKIFDFENKGLTKSNYRAFTYDFVVSNETKYVLTDFRFKLTFDRDVYLYQVWNGQVEIHQNVSGDEYVATVPRLMEGEFDANEYGFDTFTSAENETMIHMQKGDYLIYLPSVADVEIPIEPFKNSKPAIILYTPYTENINESTVDFDYTVHRQLSSDPFFWVAAVGLGLWILAFINIAITSVQIRKYNARHERDNEIIRESIETFTGFIDAKDPYTNGHSKRVAKYTRIIAEEMGYSGEELDRIYYIALLHDCGKIGVPDNILRKPDKLTAEEFEVIKSHTKQGGEILSSFKSLKDVEEGARYHHERFDGKGYPEGRAGSDIPLIARMICVADSFDAMNSNRVYRKKLTKEMIISEIEKNKGKQFDPEIADIFLAYINENDI